MKFNHVIQEEIELGELELRYSASLRYSPEERKYLKLNSPQYYKRKIRKIKKIIKERELYDK